MVIPVVASSLVFTYVHSSPYGFAFIFIGGCVLALIYKLTGSLLCSMLGHFLYNGLQILMEFAAHYNQGVKRIVSADFLPFYIPLIGLLIFAGSFYALVRTQTPLPEDWSADFRPGEEEGNEEMKGMKK
jgi:membrane protease YdiL (CAAX protease family)